MATTTPGRVHLNAYVAAGVREQLKLIARTNDRPLSAEVRLGLWAEPPRRRPDAALMSVANEGFAGR